jgi:predicted secreted protein
MSDGFSQLFSPPLSSGISEKKKTGQVDTLVAELADTLHITVEQVGTGWNVLLLGSMSQSMELCGTFQWAMASRLSRKVCFFGIRK